MNSVAASWKATTDRGAANALYDGRPLWWHRRTVSKAPLYLARGASSILLLVQPEAIAPALGKDAVSDGLMERFLFDWSAADPHQPQPSAGSLEWADGIIKRVIDRCSALGDVAHPRDGEPLTYSMRFPEKTAERFVSWRDSIFAEDERVTGRVSSYVGKAPGHAARLATAIEIIAWAMTDETHPPEFISDSSVDSAMMLRGTYYAQHLRKVMSDAAMPAAEKLAAAAARYIVNERPASIDPLFLRTRAKVPGLRSREELLLALGELESRNWLASGVKIPHFRDFRAELPAAIPLHPRLYEFV